MENQALDGSSSRNSILNAIAVIMLDTDYDKITVRDVVAEANVSRSTFYRLFSSVDEAIGALEDKYLGLMAEINRIGLMADMGENSTKRTPSMVLRLELFQANAPAFLALLGPHANPRTRRKEAQLMEAYFQTKRADENLTPEERDLYLRFVIDGHNSLLHRWLSHYPALPAEDVASLLNELFYAPLLSRRK
ncbi:MAG: TetR/AcrR family transcriptional regulator [Eggerthellaceae bacterium]|nr:TetR/AcrR family transcriptional regulator [Eggerthellaceae bacterium]